MLIAIVVAPLVRTTVVVVIVFDVIVNPHAGCGVNGGSFSRQCSTVQGYTQKWDTHTWEGTIEKS
jgi:hypothetical protein